MRPRFWLYAALALAATALHGQEHRRRARAGTTDAVDKVVVCQAPERTLVVGDTLQLRPVLFDTKTHDRIAPGILAEWGVSDTSVAQVSRDPKHAGRLTALRPGMVAVRWRAQKAPHLVSAPFLVTVLAAGPIPAPPPGPASVTSKVKGNGCGVGAIVETS
jgi:hypothetical protein